MLSVTTGKQTTTYEYDLLGRVTATITADGARTEAAYDALGRAVTATDALGNVTKYGYTVDSLLESVTLANGAKLTAKYDLAGNLVSETDPEGSTTAYEYDPVGRMTAVTDALGATTRYEYDAGDNLAKVTDALGNETSYSYDAAGNLASETDALGNTVKYSYTPEGWLETITDAEGQVTRYTYDRTGNILTTDYAGEQTETNTYNELGLLTTITTAAGVTEYQYDQASRLLSVKQPNGETVRYTYDGRGNRASMTYPNGKTVTYTYDAMDRMVSVKGVDGVTTKYSYDALGRRTATTGGKTKTSYAYDEVGNLVSQTTTGAYDLALGYVYDKAGRMTGETRTEQGATIESSYVYDALGQLTSFTRSDGLSESYAYDAVGNMTAKTANGVKTSMSYNAANQLVKRVSGGETTRYSYDANGNLVKAENADGARSYAYNALGLLSQFTREDGYSESYTYNANRLLSGITNDTGTTSFTYDILYGEGVVIGESRNGQTTNYTYGLDRISAITGKTRTEYVYDGRGSVAAEVSYNKAWYTFGGGLARKNVTSKSYTPFGEQLGEAATGFGYNGEYYNAATGMVYLRARFYEPELNRFSQKDLLRGEVIQPGSLNRYLYVQNDPINFVDPSGMRLVDDWPEGSSTRTTPKSTPRSNTPPDPRRDTSAHYATQNDRPQPRGGEQMGPPAPPGYGQNPSQTPNPERVSVIDRFLNLFKCDEDEKARKKEKAEAANKRQAEINRKAEEAVAKAEAQQKEIIDSRADLIREFTAEVIYPSIEAKAGVGQGLGGEFNVLDLGVDLQMSGNYIEFCLDDGNWTAGQSLKAEASIDLFFVDVGGRYVEKHDLNGNELPGDSYAWISPNSSYGVSLSGYALFLGGSVSLEINYVDFIENFDDFVRRRNEK